MDLCRRAGCFVRVSHAVSSIGCTLCRQSRETPHECGVFSFLGQFVAARLCVLCGGAGHAGLRGVEARGPGSRAPIVGEIFRPGSYCEETATAVSDASISAQLAALSEDGGSRGGLLVPLGQLHRPVPRCNMSGALRPPEPASTTDPPGRAHCRLAARPQPRRRRPLRLRSGQGMIPAPTGRPSRTSSPTSRGPRRRAGGLPFRTMWRLGSTLRWRLAMS